MKIRTQMMWAQALHTPLSSVLFLLLLTSSSLFFFLISLVSILVTSVAREERENERVSGRGWPMPNRCQ